VGKRVEREPQIARISAEEEKNFGQDEQDLQDEERNWRNVLTM
jgi:hypothetical protein